MTGNTEPTAQTVLHFGDFRLDLDPPRLYRHSDPVQLGAKPMAILALLALQRPRVISKNELPDKVWGGRRTPNTVEQAVKQLREALGESAAQPSYIETVPGEGYRFIGALIDSPPERVAPPVANAGPPRRTIRSKWAVATMAACLAAAVAIWYLRRPTPTISRVAITPNAAIATDELGRVLWRYPFAAPVREAPITEAKWRSQVVDLDGDGTPEVLLATERETFRGESADPEVVCLSSRGKLIWRYRPSTHMEFRTKDLNGPWRLSHILAVPEKHGETVWVAVTHSVWWPAFVARISPAGTPDIAFTSSGEIEALYLMQAKSGTYVLAGGINNEYRQAFVAALAIGAPPSASPQSKGTEFECLRGCPSGEAPSLLASASFGNQSG